MLKFKTLLSYDSFLKGQERKTITKKFLSTVFAIFVAIVVSAILVGILGYNIRDFFIRLFTKWIGSPDIYLTKVAILGIAALSFIFAFKAGLFNIGISGQMLGSGLIMLLVVKNMQIANINMPNVLGQFFLLIIAMLAGAMFAVFIGILKVFLKINEVVSSILLNWIMFYITRYVVFTAQSKMYNPTPDQVGSRSIPFADNYSLFHLASGYGYLFALLIFISLSIIIWVILKYTVFGHKVLSVGKSFDAAKYAGYRTKIISLATFAISGALAGALAMVNYTSTTTNAIVISQAADALPTQGYDGIAMGLISLTHPLATIPVSFLMGLLQQSADNLGGSFPQDLSGIIISFVMLGAAMFILFERISPVYWIYHLIYTYKGKDYYRDYENKNNNIISEYKAIYSEINKKRNQYLQELKKLRKELDQFKNHEQYNKVNQQYEYTISYIKTTYNAWLKVEYDKYLKQLKNNAMQLKKHLIIERATLVYYPEINTTRKIKNKLKHFENISAKKLSRIKDKIHNEDFLIKNLVAKEISKYAQSKSYDYNKLKYLLQEYENNNSVLTTELVNELSLVLKDEQAQLMFSEFKQASFENNLDHMIDLKNQIMTYINSLLDSRLEQLSITLKSKNLVHDEQMDKIILLLNPNDKILNKIIISRNKHLENYTKEITKLELRNISQDDEIKKNTKQRSSSYLTKHYEKTKQHINKIKLDQEQKLLLEDWLTTAYQKAIINQQNMKEVIS